MAPHNLISLSMYEQSIPNEEKRMNLTLVHKKEAVKKVQVPSITTGYTLKVFENNPFIYESDRWGSLFAQVQKYMNENGPDEGYLLTSYNRSCNDLALVYVVSWSKDSEDFYRNAERPVDCCGCNLF
jgi:hypothetical protein